MPIPGTVLTEPPCSESVIKGEVAPVLKYHTMKTYGGNGGEWSASPCGSFTPGERAPATPWIGGWVDPRAGLDAVKRNTLPMPGIEPLAVQSIA